ncbi:PAS/PAC sensor signal transduction histidine kinase [Methanosalsum zhilinae DSM 4017]|uniref:histidine kinase n=1 Tax=Methanosalsum zhilinae (strain DSM 4017 / NBRC 107636 / OCM 62 / WeN5) TaxID=679901 RepID=F7XQN6_METZD|nr:ATP-binding protein [Methanosalsum zhilinae]AEH61635.1 PAS/PAC sensor signal transduction histidine kinase [Methanosalsum zhilinae DSM 4017]
MDQETEGPDRHESCMRFRMIFENCPTGMLYINRMGLVDDCNSKSLEILAVSRDDIVGSDPGSFLSGEQINEVIESILSSKVNYHESEYRTKNHDNPIPLKVYLSPLPDQELPSGVICVLEDISREKSIEEALLMDESRLEALLRLHQMTDATIQEITDFAREEAVRLTGSKLGYLAFLNETEDVLTMHSWSRVAMKICRIRDKPIEYPVGTTGLWGEAVRQRKPVITNDYREPNPLKKGYPKGHVELTRHMNVPVFDKDKIVLVAGVGNKDTDYDQSDVRQLTLLMQGMWTLLKHKKAEDALKKYSNKLSQVNKELWEANKELKSLNQLKNEFISNVSHELKTPLVSIRGYSEIMNGENLGPLNDKQKRAVETILRNSERLRRHVDSLMYISMEQMGKIRYSFDSINIEGIIDDAITDILPQIRDTGKDLKLEKNVSEDLPEIQGDAQKLTDLLTNLLSNSVKFTPDGGRISINVKQEGDELHIVVEDTGIGIPKEVIPDIFDRFYQIDSSTKRKFGGTGVGLYICKSIVEGHSGKIWVESDRGKGTSVHVKLPVKNRPEEKKQ